MEHTPNYIQSLLKPTAKRPQGRKVWSIDLEAVWLPFFTATNVMGDSQLPGEALGAPIRLAYGEDGATCYKSGKGTSRLNSVSP